MNNDSRIIQQMLETAMAMEASNEEAFRLISYLVALDLGDEMVQNIKAKMLEKQAFYTDTFIALVGELSEEGRKRVAAVANAASPY